MRCCINLVKNCKAGMQIQTQAKQRKTMLSETKQSTAKTCIKNSDTSRKAEKNIAGFAPVFQTDLQLYCHITSYEQLQTESDGQTDHLANGAGLKLRCEATDQENEEPQN